MLSGKTFRRTLLAAGLLAVVSALTLLGVWQYREAQYRNRFTIYVWAQPHGGERSITSLDIRHSLERLETAVHDGLAPVFRPSAEIREETVVGEFGFYYRMREVRRVRGSTWEGRSTHTSKSEVQYRVVAGLPGQFPVAIFREDSQSPMCQGVDGAFLHSQATREIMTCLRMAIDSRVPSDYGLSLKTEERPVHSLGKRAQKVECLLPNAFGGDKC